MRYSWFILAFVALASSCKEDSFQEPRDFGYDYQPGILGHWVAYQVDSITYSDITNPATIVSVNYYVREVLDTFFIDASGVENIRVEQFKKYNLTEQWILNEVGSFKLSSENFQRNFNDLRFVNLLFPVKNDKEWNGHLFLDVNNEASLEYLDVTRYDWRYRYSEVNEPKQVGNFSLDSCLVVTQIDEENLFEKKYSKEIYAKNIGLVSKELIILNTQAPPSGASFIDRAESGFILRYTLIDYQN